jgi:RHS repeat-associated protein
LKPGRNLTLDVQYGETSDTLNLLGIAKGGAFRKGQKFFELANHLGNVLVTISDKKLGIDTNGDSTVNYYMPDVMTANDYYPFGMGMPERKFAASNAYRYGFNGKEKASELSNDDYDFGLRMYDARIARWLSVDPIIKSYESPYISFANSPIWIIDPSGADTIPSFSVPGYVQGKPGNKIASTRLEHNGVIKVLYPEWIAQAMNFSDAIGGYLTVEESRLNSDRVSAATKVKVNIYKDNEIVTETVRILKEVHKIELDDEVIKQFIVDQAFVFKEGNDYSSLFWVKIERLKLSRTIVIAAPVSIPVVMPLSSTNTKEADLVVVSKVVTKQLADGLAPILKFAEHVKNARNSTKGKHEKGQTRKKKDRDGSKGMEKAPRKRPKGWKGPWPPKQKK